MGLSTARVYKTAEEGYWLLLSGDRLVLSLGNFESLAECQVTIETCKEQLDSSGVGTIYDLVTGSIGDPVHSEPVGLSTAKIYQGKDKRYCLFVIGDRLAFFLGSYLSLEECRNLISCLHDLQSVLEPALDVQAHQKGKSSN
jgi:hypothetical protein